MLTYCRGTDLTQLADHLLEELEQNLPQNPLAPETFVVQNHGMAQWLSLYIAERRGIAANLKFEFPAERIWSLIRVMDPSVPETLPSDREPMTWAIMHILKKDEDPQLEVLQQYVAESDSLKQEVRRWKLAGRIADVLDQYLTYRPEMLIAWEQRRLTTSYASERWQSVLWRKLIDHWDEHAGTDYRHRALLQQSLIKAMDEGAIGKQELPGRITVFGVSTMPPVYLKILVKLSKLTDVFFYTLEPDNQQAHPLHTSLGKTGQEYRGLLKKFIAEEKVESRVLRLDNGKKKEPKTLFNDLRAIFLDSGNESGPIPKDNTIQIHSCHSPRREVEVFYDQLLAMFDEDESLNPSDILVLTPDLGAYASEIEAVFGTVEEDLPEIPYHLAERSAHANPVNQGVAKILELAESRLKVTDVLDLLDFKPIQQKFKLSDDNLNTLERWIADNRIRWGRDGRFKAAFGLPESESFTWQSGLNRMMLGYAMKPQDDELFNGICPYQEVEQSEDTLLAGRFYNVMNVLFGFCDEVNISRTLRGWSRLLNTWLPKFFPDDEAYFRDMQRIRELINRPGEHAALSGFEGKVSFRIIRLYLEDALEQQQTGGGRTGQGVTFSSMVPMRNIPAKVVCMLGMNDGAFPRSNVPVAFDLMSRDPKPGDRSHNREDRQLFWEALLAARERIYASYVGQSNRQDITFPPSVVLREWMDYIMEQYNLGEKDLLTRHPLQAFSPKYFTTNSENKLFSYSAKNKNIAQNLTGPVSARSLFLTSELPDADPEYKRLTVSELIRFFQHPAKYLLQNRLGIYLQQVNVLDEDRESFRLNSLEGYRLGQELLDRYLSEQSPDLFKRVAFATDFLPDGWPGEQAFQQKSAEVQQFGSNLQDILKQEKLESFEVDLEIGDFRVTGKLDQIYETEQILYRFGSMRAKDLIELWIKHLAFQTVKPESHPGFSNLYARDRKKPVVASQLSAVANPLPILKKLLEIYWSGLKENMLFFPDSSFAFAREVCYMNSDVDKGIKAAGYKWKDDYGTYQREGDDAYNKLLIGEANPLVHNRFQEVSKSFWKPFFEVLNKEGK